MYRLHVVPHLEDAAARGLLRLDRQGQAGDRRGGGAELEEFAARDGESAVVVVPSVPPWSLDPVPWMLGWAPPRVNRVALRAGEAPW